MEMEFKGAVNAEAAQKRDSEEMDTAVEETGRIAPRRAVQRQEQELSAAHMDEGGHTAPIGSSSSSTAPMETGERSKMAEVESSWYVAGMETSPR